MKWFFALDQYSRHFESYAEMAQVATLSAKKYTSLKPHLLFDGEADHPIAAWMKQHGVQVHILRTPFYDSLKKLAEQKDDPDILGFGAGTFLRMEIPKLAQQQKWNDEFILYTDCDIMFLGDPVPDLSQLRPRFFAVAPEGEMDNWEDMNAGVMVVNMKSMTRLDEDLHAFAFTRLEGFTDYRNGQAFDQSVFRHYFRPLTRRFIRRGGSFNFRQSEAWRKYYGRFYVRLKFLDAPQWDKLPSQFNWKAYWPGGEEKGASIIHFHGPKPNENRLETSPQSLASRDNPVLKNHLDNLRNETFFAYCEIWQQMLGAEKDGHTG